MSFPGPHLPIVVFLPFVGEHRPNDVSGVFDDHFSCLDGFLAEEASTMDRRPAGMIVWRTGLDIKQVG